ncbi:hypothetical protein DNTS_031476 [Danionella cerebrum]|uniref:EGF-like domain-containing protein n=1 Tax=Danionella cerebrum TaxID=2873325 RepID=A0A553PEN7_9TELE|nr:hypothetical protein DNTS_031476 [Danionella translucida]
MQKVEIFSISDLKPYVNCTMNFANLTLELENGSWVCEGSCKNNTEFCNQHGRCLNAIDGPSCICDNSSFDIYYGPQCELYRRGSGFYAVLFSSLVAFILLVSICILTAVVIYRAKRITKTRKLSFFEEDFFDFTSRDKTHRTRVHAGEILKNAVYI